MKKVQLPGRHTGEKVSCPGEQNVGALVVPQVPTAPPDLYTLGDGAHSTSSTRIKSDLMWLPCKVGSSPT
jgi:hypothetical protein